LLRQAVRGGARAARLEEKIGSLEVGKLADIVLVSVDDYDQYPHSDPLVTLAESTTGRDVRHVIIDGRVVMRDRQILTVDLGPMRERIAHQYQKIMDRFAAAIG